MPEFLRSRHALAHYLARFRGAELLVFVFFLYAAALCFVYNVSPGRKLIGVAAPIFWVGITQLAIRGNSVQANLSREWAIPAVVLAGYWEMGWFAKAHPLGLQDLWLLWDRTLLDTWGLRMLIEQRVPFLPWFLELSYLLLYAIPAACIAVIYWKRARARVDRYLLTFALGTLTAYALLPVLAAQSPRLAFPGQDLPGAHPIWRSANIWILDHLDISTSVFPSGHVAVAFSSAFGMRRALPEHRVVFGIFLSLAMSVWVSTVYGRYHYAVDGVASIVISLAAWGLCEAYELLA